MGSLAKRARQPESARGGGWAGGAGGANKLGRFMSAAKVAPLYRFADASSGVLRRFAGGGAAARLAARKLTREG
jgi:hypothetical protein